MSIPSTCQKCGKTYKVKEELAGQKCKCKVCGGVVLVPKLPEPVEEEFVATPDPEPAPEPKKAVPQKQTPSNEAKQEPPAKPPKTPLLKKNRKAADIVGIVSMALGFGAFVIQIIGGLCCGWIGWPLGILAIAGAVVTFLMGNMKRHKIMGIVAIFLSVIGLVIQILVLAGLVHHASSQAMRPFPTK